MNFQVGDIVIHWSYGMGKIVQLDEKVLSGQKMRYYVVRARDLTVWVPVNATDKCSLRLPAPRSEFEKLFAILRSPCEPLSEDRLERKTQLLERMKEGKPESTCRLVRDLTFYRQTKRLNESDLSILERALNSLLNEWHFSLSVSLAQAERELRQLLEEHSHEAIVFSGTWIELSKSNARRARAAKP